MLDAPADNGETSKTDGRRHRASAKGETGALSELKALAFRLQFKIEIESMFQIKAVAGRGASDHTD